MILFETTESVIEILWDIVLAIYIVRIAFAYFLLNFLSGLALSYLAYSRLTPVTHLTTPQSELVLIPFLLLGSAIWARAVIVYYEVPRVGGFRLVSGAVAGLFMVLAEMVVAFVLYEEGRWVWEDVGSLDVKTGLAFAGLLLAYVVMPAAHMLWERKEGEGQEVEETTTSHGHEKKSLVDAVPTVSLAEKKRTKAD